MAFTEKNSGRAVNDDRIMVDKQVILAGSCEGMAADTLVAVVCDGVGGERHGDYAAQLSAERFRDFDPEGEILSDIIRNMADANEQIMKKQETDPEYLRMATTLAGIVIRGTEYYVFNVGDTRVYGACPEKLICLSEDHTRERELKIHAKNRTVKIPGFYSNIITRYIGGTGNACTPFIGVHNLKKGAIFLLCSDGAYKSFPEEDLEHILTGKDPLQDKYDNIVRRLRESSHRDDKSFILLECA